MSRYITAKEAVSRVMKSIALTPPATVSGSTQSIPQQMFNLLSEFGQELLVEYDWQIKNRTQTINVQAPTTEYDVPSDLVSYVDGTGWNFTSRLPMVGPVTNQQWQELNARNLGPTTFAMIFQISNDKMVFYYAPDDVQVCKINYISNGWVQDGSDPTVYKDAATADADIILFNPTMFVAGLELAWKKKKGFPTADEEIRYRRLLAAAKYNDKPRNTLSTSGQQQYPYLGMINIPDTNYGG